jgi:uncharacterized membrane protein YeaQ/YmgE (transglycosylase-associated protein family)
MQIVVLLVLAILALILIGPVIGLTANLIIPIFLWMLAGMFAGRILRGRGYGPLGDILLGLIGGLVGNLVLGLFGVHMGGLIGTLLAGTLGALIVVYLVRLVGNSQFAR